MKKYKKLIILVFAVMLLTGCAKVLKDENKKAVQTSTGQNLIENILCKPTKEETIKLYEKNNVDLSKLPECSAFKPTTGGYEGIWATIFVKPLAWVILKVGKYVKNYGLAIIIITLALRLIVMPFTKKTAMQSENMKKAGPELEKLEAKYRDKQSQQEMMMKSQEMLAIYKKYNISPMSGCIFAIIQIPLFFAFYESMNRLPVVFEGTFLKVFNLGTSPLTAMQNGQWYYFILVVLVAVVTYFSFKLNKTVSMNSEQAKSMKMTTNITVIFITIAAFSISTSIALYWIFNSGFTIIQNLLVKRGK